MFRRGRNLVVATFCDWYCNTDTVSPLHDSKLIDIAQGRILATSTVECEYESPSKVQKEEAQVGSVASDVYSTYIQAAGGWCLATTVLFGVLFGQGALGCRMGVAGYPKLNRLIIIFLDKKRWFWQPPFKRICPPARNGASTIRQQNLEKSNSRRSSKFSFLKLLETTLSRKKCNKCSLQGLQALAGGWISYWSDHSKPQSPHHISSQVGLIGYSSLSLAVPWTWSSWPWSCSWTFSGWSLPPFVWNILTEKETLRFFVGNQFLCQLISAVSLQSKAFLGIFLTSALFRLTALKAARTFHRKLLGTVLRLPMAFFDTTPLGRVLNRFSKDIYTIDEVLQNILYSYLQVGEQLQLLTHKYVGKLFWKR